MRVEDSKLEFCRWMMPYERCGLQGCEKDVALHMTASKCIPGQACETQPAKSTTKPHVVVWLLTHANLCSVPSAPAAERGGLLPPWR